MPIVCEPSQPGNIAATPAHTHTYIQTSCRARAFINNANTVSKERYSPLCARLIFYIYIYVMCMYVHGVARLHVGAITMTIKRRRATSSGIYLRIYEHIYSQQLRNKNRVYDDESPSLIVYTHTHSVYIVYTLHKPYT